ncbi:hypothetical protein FVE85_1647 [Porphyridium purpureum]|uniref:Uncharacterized protein n=1 Tax=Porphyridium purpureum TaxID=35688 RepID=A0A5J4YX96_PORPP|nr:hypothetical protein FVE85_1647 [Porphyridium purpureum]|eukprot:POR5605..scf209_3
MIAPLYATLACLICILAGRTASEHLCESLGDTRTASASALTRQKPCKRVSARAGPTAADMPAVPPRAEAPLAELALDEAHSAHVFKNSRPTHRMNQYPVSAQQRALCTTRVLLPYLNPALDTDDLRFLMKGICAFGVRMARSHALTVHIMAQSVKQFGI